MMRKIELEQRPVFNSSLLIPHACAGATSRASFLLYNLPPLELWMSELEVCCTGGPGMRKCETSELWVFSVMAIT